MSPHRPLKREVIRMAFRGRLYDLFCEGCHCVHFSECEHLQRIVCDGCGDLFGYRMHAEKEKAFIENTMTRGEVSSH